MKWSEEEKGAIVRLVASKGLTDEDLQKLKADLPGRSVTQIKDQYRQIIKPQIMAFFSGSSSSPASSTPSPKKRSRNNGSDDL